MKQFSIEVQDSKVGFFIELMRSLNFVKVKGTPINFELTPAQKAELDKRYEEYTSNPDSFVEWDTLCQNIEKRLCICFRP